MVAGIIGMVLSIGVAAKAPQIHKCAPGDLEKRLQAIAGRANGKVGIATKREQAEQRMA